MTTYRISQLAERVGLRPTTLLFYEQAGLLPAQRSESGYRLYDDEAIERLGFIASGKRLGLPLEEIRDLLQVWEDGLCTDVRQRLRPMLVDRIAEAEQRTAELDAFVHRLRRALAEVDGPSRPGRCDPGCGFLHPEPVPVAPAPIACTLDATDQNERIGQWQHVLGQAHRREPIEGGQRIEWPPHLAGEVAALATAEQHCCAFFTFTLHLSADGVRLDVRAPDEAAPLLTDIFGTA